MVRRGQIFSIDAFISIIVLIMVLSAVSATSESLRMEIGSLIGWYERANIANNMLDVLLDTPGVPPDWEANPVHVRVVGLRDSENSYFIDYTKLEVLGEKPATLLSALLNESSGKDFLISVYVSRFRVSISGHFPRVYLQNMTFANPNGNPPGVNLEITSGNGNNPFTVTWVQLKRDGNVYTNEGMCSLVKGNTIALQSGDVLSFVLNENITLTAKRGQYTETYSIPKGAKVIITITGEGASNFQINYGGGSCPYTFKFGGQGNVVITVSAYDNTTPAFNSTYVFFTQLLQNGTPSYSFAAINGTLVTDNGTILASMNRSSWVEVAQRIVVVGRMVYNLSAGPSNQKPLIYGVLTQRLPSAGYLNITVPSSEGNLTLFVLSGNSTGGLFVYRDSGGDLWGVVVRGNSTVRYRGGGSSLIIPLRDVLGNPSRGDILGLWLYSLNGWARGKVSIKVSPPLNWFLRPKLEQALIQLKVWDDP